MFSNIFYHLSLNLKIDLFYELKYFQRRDNLIALTQKSSRAVIQLWKAHNVNISSGQLSSQDQSGFAASHLLNRSCRSAKEFRGARIDFPVAPSARAGPTSRTFCPLLCVDATTVLWSGHACRRFISSRRSAICHGVFRHRSGTPRSVCGGDRHRCFRDDHLWHALRITPRGLNLILPAEVCLEILLRRFKKSCALNINSLPPLKLLL